jgi:hypothetical protein
LIKLQSANTAALGGEPIFTGWCLAKEDLCVAKLCAFQEKDRAFVASLLQADLVERDMILRRLTEVPERYLKAGAQVAAWISSF